MKRIVWLCCFICCIGAAQSSERGSLVSILMRGLGTSENPEVVESPGLGRQLTDTEIAFMNSTMARISRIEKELESFPSAEKIIFDFKVQDILTNLKSTIALLPDSKVRQSLESQLKICFQTFYENRPTRLYEEILILCDKMSSLTIEMFDQ